MDNSFNKEIISKKKTKLRLMLDALIENRLFHVANLGIILFLVATVAAKYSSQYTFYLLVTGFLLIIPSAIYQLFYIVYNLFCNYSPLLIKS